MIDEMLKADIAARLKLFRPVFLEDIDRVRLMDRTDLKYVFESYKLPALISELNGHYNMLEIDQVRIMPYLTTYFDTDDFDFFNQHVRGKLNRYKMRYRTYGVTGESFLEIKMKTNRGRTVKWRINDRIGKGGFDEAASSFISQHLPVSADLVSPALSSIFSRITFTGNEIPERLTIDFSISFSSPVSGKTISLPHVAVAELKREAAAEYSHFRHLARQFHIYPSSFSKYCIGTALLNNPRKKNMIKSKLLLLKKLEK